MAENQNVATFHCLQCPYDCEWGFQLDNHKKRTHPLICLFPDFDCAQQNMEQEVCELCAFKKENRFEVYEHFGTVHLGRKKPRKPPLYTCEHCVFTTSSPLVKMQHVSKHGTTGSIRTEAYSYHCTECSYHSRRLRNVKVHLTFACRKQLLAQTASNFEGRKSIGFFCTRCSYHTEFKSVMERHLLIHTIPIRMKHFDKMYCCTECPYESDSKVLLVKHHGEKHPDPSNEIGWYQCENCSYCSKDLDNFNKHKWTCLGRDKIASFACAKCPVKVSTKIGFDKHMAWHRGEEVIKCATCSFTTNSTTSLNVHKAFCVNRINSIGVSGSNIFGLI